MRVSVETVSTKHSLLDAAERLFAEQGIRAASLRAITAEANANLAAVNYHFGSKEGLVREVFRRRLGPMNGERLELLDALEHAAAPAAPRLEEVLRAFYEPPLKMRWSLDAQGEKFVQLLGRAFYETGEEVRRILMHEFGEVMCRFIGALGKALPELPEPELYWRFHFAVGSLTHVLSNPMLLERSSGGLCRFDDEQAVLERLVGYAAAGLRTGSNGGGHA